MRKRGLKDDTTCVVVDIVPPYNNRPLPSPRPPKKYDILKALLFRKKYTRSANKLAKRLSAVGIVEELFEEGSAMLAERFVFSFTLYSIAHMRIYFSLKLEIFTTILLDVLENSCTVVKILFGLISFLLSNFGPNFR